MKKISRVVLVLVLTICFATVAFAGKPPANTMNPDQPGTFTNQPAGCPTNMPAMDFTNAPPPFTNAPSGATNAATQLAARAATFYAAISAFDTNKDGSLDSAEQTMLFNALTNGTVELFGTNIPCKFAADDTSNIVLWAATLYALIAPFDTNGSGTLDNTEQAALAAALEAGTVSLQLFAPLMMPPDSETQHRPALSRAYFVRTAESECLLLLENGLKVQGCC